MTIDELIDSGINQARTVLIGKPGAELAPAFVIQFKDRAPAVIGTPWSGDREKQIAIFVIRKALKTFEASVVSYLFWSEAWMATEDMKHPLGLMPRDREDRKEVVMINAFTKAGEGKMVTLEIVRDDKAVITDLIRSRDSGDYDRMGGRLHNLFNDD